MIITVTLITVDKATTKKGKDQDQGKNNLKTNITINIIIITNHNLY